MTISDRSKNGPLDYKKLAAWKGKPRKRLGAKKIRCFVFQCRNIPSADADGSSDSYISIWNPEGEKYKTQVIEDSLNPIYLETIEMLYDMADLDTAPPIILNIWDKDEDLLDSTDDYLGRAVIYLKDASSNLTMGEDEAYCNTMPKPKWHDIRVGFDETQPPCGQILVSFIIARDDFEFQTPAKYVDLDKMIPKKDYMLDINVLGLRNLESFGLMPIKKPYIKFRVKSLLPPAKAMAVTNVQTDPNANGPNPNINTTLTFNVNLPMEKLYCPSLECDVFDFVYRGFQQPLVGTFSIPIGEIKNSTEEKWKKNLEIQDMIINQLVAHSGKSGDQIRGEAKSKADAQMLKARGKLANKLKQKAAKRLAKRQPSEEAEGQLIASERKDGYAQLDDDLEASVSRPIDSQSILFEEEKKMEADEDIIDGSLFQGRDENDPLIL